MKDTDFTMAEIKELIKTFRESGLSVMKVQQGAFTLELEQGGSNVAVAAAAPLELPAAVQAALPAPAISGNVVKSPIVGTFYAAPAPDKPPFVTVGTSVKKGDVLFIIESMKLMNEVTSEFDGTVAEILIQNGTVVEYGQPILRIDS